MYGITFLSRTFALTTQPPVTLNVDRLTWSMEGGPSLATFSASLDNQAAQQLTHLLRCPVQVWNRFGQVVWTGYVSAIEFAGIKYDLTPMANHLKAMYTFGVNEGSAYNVQQFYTAWYSDLNSQADFGLKERIIPAGSVSAAQANSKAAQSLAALGRPKPAAANPTPGRVIITCKGWFDTLGWTYYANPAGIESYTIEGIGVANLGDVAANTYLGQSFQPATPGWDLDCIWFKLAKAGSPTDLLQVDFYPDSAGSPNLSLSLASSLVAASEIGLDYSWVKFTLDPAWYLSTGPYWIVLHRTGSVDLFNFYKVKVNESCGYPRGAFKIYDGASWSSRTPNADLNFTALGKEETTAQILDIASGDAAQFLAGVSIEDSSALYTSPFRSGARTGLQEIRALLASGTSAAEGLVANVDANRILHIHRKPSNVLLTQGEDGILRDPLGQIPTPNHVVAQWVKIQRPGIGVVDTQFISQVEVSGDGKMSIK